MKNPTFRTACQDDAERVFELYNSVIGTPFCVWNDLYPGQSEIQHDLETDNLFVLEEDKKIIGAISIVPENELDGLNCRSSYKNVGEFARVVIHPDHQGKGSAQLLVSNVLRIMKNRGLEAVRISVAKKNIPAQKTYAHFGFITTGEMDMWGHSYYLYELKL